MALNAKKALAASKSYTDETVLGGGALKGKNCVINSITDIAATSQKPAGKRVTFGWTLDTGVEQTSIMDVFNGVDGQGINRMYVDNDSHLIVVYDDGTEEDCGEITVPMAQSDWNETDPLSNSYIRNKPGVDDHLDPTSENPVQNKVVAAAVVEVSQADALADWNAVFGSEFNPTTDVEVPSVTLIDPSDVIYEND